MRCRPIWRAGADPVAHVVLSDTLLWPAGPGLATSHCGSHHTTSHCATGSRPSATGLAAFHPGFDAGRHESKLIDLSCRDPRGKRSRNSAADLKAFRVYVADRPYYAPGEPRSIRRPAEAANPHIGQE